MSGERGGDTIAAIATAPGRGGIGIVRVSGPQAAEIASAVLGVVPQARLARKSKFLDSAGTIIDEGIALFFPAPNSYTGEPVLELQGHGGQVVLEAMLASCLDAGARVAEPGEFTRRAFLAGKLDLVQAEAVADLIEATSREAARSAARSLSGEFSGAVGDLAAELGELRALTEAVLDFPEEEVDDLQRDEAGRRLDVLRIKITNLLNRCRDGRLLRNGLRVVIVGPPNVGKSSILNRLAGDERAIVTDIAGTTRDVLRESILIEGVPVLFSDTAGFRDAPDRIESIGIERALQELQHADLAIVVESVDLADAARMPIQLPETVQQIPVLNKIDLSSATALDERLGLSALTGEGFDELRKALLKKAGWLGGSEPAFLARERHVRALVAAAECLEQAAAPGLGWEFFAEDLRRSQEALEGLIGRTTPDDVLGDIFSRFCIGK